MQRLEDFILDNREEFDSETPDLRVWAKLNQQLEVAASSQSLLADEKPQARVLRMPMMTAWSNRLRMAASITGFLLTGVAVGFYLNSSSNKSELATISAEYGEMERFYQQQIEKKSRQLVSVKNSEEIKEDLNQLDEVMNELRAELTNAPKGSREQIIRNMIASYKTKMDILERVLDENQSRGIVQTNQNINFKNEKDTI